MTTPNPKITLYRGQPTPSTYVWSPFVTKVELRLRASGITFYQTEAGSTTSAPKGKIPYIKLSSADGGHSRELADSTLMLNQLTEMGVVGDVNAGIGEREKAIDLGLRALLEEKLYFYHKKSRERWMDNYYTMRDNILASLSYPLRVVVGAIIYRQTYAGLQKQGTGRFTDAEIASLRLEIWQCFSDLLILSRRRAKSEAEPFWVLGSEGMTEADATLFGFIVSVLMCDAAPESRKVVRGFPVLLDYVERIHQRWFPDYRRWEEQWG